MCGSISNPWFDDEVELHKRGHGVVRNQRLAYPRIFRSGKQG